MSDVHEWNRRIIDEFRANGGRVGGPFEGRQVLLLHHRGARSGFERVNPLAYQRLGDSVAVFASNNGAPRNPDWYHNLIANPEASIEIGSETRQVRARLTRGAERERIWSAQKAAIPTFAGYEQTSAGRQIPVFVLDPA